MCGISKLKKEGTSLLQLVDAATALGFICEGLEIGITHLNSVNLPVILYWNQCHFVVLFKILKDIYYIADPASGIFKITETELLDHWYAEHSTQRTRGILLTFSVIKQV